MNFIKVNNQKRPLTPYNPKYYSNDYNQWNNSAFIIGTDVIVLDFDGDNPNDNEVMNYIEKEYPTLIVKTKRGKHFYYKMPSTCSFTKLIDGKSCLGFQCDYLTGEKTQAVVKVDGKVREMNKKFSYESMAILPEVLYPFKKGKKLSGMDEGDGRNNSLYAHLLAVRESFPEIDINMLANEINNNIFGKKLEKSELKEIIKSAKKKDIKVIEKKEIKYSSFEELQSKQLPPITFFVKDLIPQGLTIISSLPKIGKSWMALDIGLCVASGTPFLGFNTLQSGVLYLALEDSENRLQDRTNKILSDKKAPSGFMYAIRCDDLENGLIDELEEIKKKEPNLKIIIIDTLQKIRSNYKGNNAYANDYKEISPLKAFADKYGMSVIVIHHLKKGHEGDVFEKVSGTNGLIGSVDTNIVIEKEDRFKDEAVLSISGRDVENNQYIIRFDKEKFKWNMIGSYEEQKEELEKEDYKNNPVVQMILQKVKDNNGIWETTCKEFKEELLSEYSNFINPNIKINESRLKPLEKKLKKYDNICFWLDGVPRDGKRILTFKKIVDNVENVDDDSTNSTNSTKSTKKGDV